MLWLAADERQSAVAVLQKFLLRWPRFDPDVRHQLLLAELQFHGTGRTLLNPKKYYQICDMNRKSLRMNSIDS